MRYVNLILAILLLVCLLPMPYGYYTLVRFIAMTIFAFLAFSYYDKENKPTPLVFTFGALALLFQPFFKIVLGRTLWNVVDIMVAILLVILWYIENDNKNKTNFL